MSDRERLLEALRAAGDRGIHTFEIRKGGISGNPSERRRELLALGYGIRAEREKMNGRWGKRFFLEHDAAAGAGTCESDAIRCSSSVGRGGGIPPSPADQSPGSDARSAGRLFDIAGEPLSAALHDWDEAA